MDKQHVMDPLSLGQTSPESQEERRDSMEDADCSPTRFKRPRLDSGSRATRNMSDAERLPRDITSAPATPSPRKELHEATFAHTPLTPSRVTINVRAPQTPSHNHDPATSSVAANAPPNEAVDTMDPDQDTDSSATLRSSPSAHSLKSKVHTPSPDATRTDSALSPTHSPVLEIEPQEVDDERDSVVEIGDDGEEAFSDNILDDFPYAQQVGRDTAVGGIYNIIAKPRQSQSLDGELTLLKQWLVDLSTLVQRGKLDLWAAYFKEPKFWEDISRMFWRITQRQVPYGEAFNLDPDQSEEDALQDLWQAYATCVAQLLRAEIELLEKSAQSITRTTHIMSLSHMKALMEMLRFTTEVPFWALAKDVLGANTMDMCSSIMGAFLKEFEGLQRLVVLIRLGVSNTALRPVAEESMRFIQHLSWFANTWSVRTTRPADRRWIARQLLALFKELDQEIQASLKAPVELCSELVQVTENLLHWTAGMDDDAAKQLALEIHGDAEDATRISQWPPVVAELWLLKTLKQYILKGHMAHRIYGVESMSQHFVALWSKWSKTSDGSGLPVLELFSRFLLEEGIIDFIIGVDSHPQLVSRSGNIVGFLAVNNHYGESQTDAIWNSITQSQDPRMVEALIDMLGHTANLMGMPELLYLCTKFRTLPVTSFTASFLELFRKICTILQSKTRTQPSAWSEDENRMNAFDLCIYLAQESFPTESSTPLAESLHRVACQELSNLSKPDMASTEDRQRIYEACAQDVKEMTHNAAASAQIISIVAQTSAPTDAMFLAGELKLTYHVAKELCSFVETQRTAAQKSQNNALASRLELLFFLMSNYPESICPEMQEAVWNHLIGRNAISKSTRDIAWHNLTQMVKSQVTENAFLDRCATDLLPKVEPDFYTPGLFDFLRQVTDYQRRTSRAGEISVDGTVDPPSVELLWRVILTAPDNTIEGTTAEYLANLYLDGHAFRSHAQENPNVIQDTHTALIRRCVRQLISAHTALKTPMDNASSKEVEMRDVGSSEDSKLLERQFQRTFLFLTLLLDLVRKRLDFQISSPRPRKATVPTSCETTAGEPTRISFQAFGAPQTNEIQSVTLGDLETLSWLEERLREWTGFAEVKLIHGGNFLDLKKLGDCTIRELDLDKKGAILVKKHGDWEATPYNQGTSTIIEKEILKNYDIMYDFMDGGDDSLSAATFEFLRLLPPHGKALAITYSGRQTSSIADIAASAFPPGKTYKARTSVFTLKKELKNHMRLVYARVLAREDGAAVNVEQGPVNVQLISHSVQLLNTAILNEDLIDGSLSGSHDGLLAWLALEAFNEFLKERVEPDVSASYFSDTGRLVDRLMSFLNASLRRSLSVSMTCFCYMTILEASQHNRGIWEAFTGRDDLDELHLILLLSHNEEGIRQTTSLNIENNCRHISDKSCVKENDIVPFYWNILSKLIPHAATFSKNSKQLFELSVKVFRWYDELQRDEAILRGYISTWSNLMLGYKHETFVGRTEVDFVVLGFAQLLRTAVQSLKSFKKPLNIENLATQIFTGFLFPTASENLANEECDISGTLPVLDTGTREELYELVMALCEDASVYRHMVDLNRQLLRSCSPQQGEMYVLGGSRDLRSETGYVGLENPQALCYMNSLMTQLFMDLEFRTFVFEAKGSGDDGLLKAMKELFANMQSSYGRSVDIRPFARCVRGTDKKPINVAIQMDTEEFFRLLMDQLESQLATAEDRQRLRNFYGGRSVNQIKSKDCQHVSETTETLFNLPLEVKGKETLEESLKAYVEGESLEGENKYKCEPCGGRLVNAVKRTCLQSVPDNLIVHLKRFDFDPFTLSRSKINDYFHFPPRINMSPYKVEYLSDPETPMEDDYFELVGILVHAGGVEQGHYWSYIRVRPDNQGGQRWIKFNDDTVTEQDLIKVESECYGGNGRHTSAYMLLYQRASAIEKGSTNILRAAQSLNPIAQLPGELEVQIAEENERYIREYCIFDQAHAAFIRKMIQQMRTLNKGICSEDHALENDLVDMAMEHVYQVTGRSQDLEELDKMLLELRKATSHCVNCTRITLDWMSNHEHALPDWLIYSYQVDGANPIGSRFGQFILDCVRELRQRDAAKYGIDVQEVDLEAALEHAKDGALYALLEKLRSMVDHLHYVPRGLEALQRPWDVYFMLIRLIAEQGPHEQALILDHGFLQMCLEICSIDSVSEIDERYPLIKHVLNRKTKVEFHDLIKFMFTMLLRIDFDADPSDGIERIRSYADSEDQKFPFASSERRLFYRWNKHDRCLVVLSRCLETCEVGRSPFVPGDIIRLMLQVEPEMGFLRSIYTTIAEGVELMPPSVGASFIMGALYFCWQCPDPRNAKAMVKDIVKCISPEKPMLAEAFQSFINNIKALHSDRWGDDRPNFFYLLTVEYAPWWATQMLSYEDQEIQTNTLKLVRQLITGILPGAPSSDFFDNEHALKARIDAVCSLARTGAEKIVNLHKEAEVPRQFVECLFNLIVDCHKWLKSLQHAFPDRYANDMEVEDLIRDCEVTEEYFKSWPESDDYDSTFSGDEELEYTDADVEGL